LKTHFIVAPLSAALGVIPLPAGPQEAGLEYLYMQVPEVGKTITKGQGLVVVLAYRLIGLLIAVVGIWFYISNRRELAAAMQDAERGDSNPL